MVIKVYKNSQALCSKESILKDNIILNFEKHFTDTRTRTSFQMDENSHQESTDPNALENYINHSCDANSYINFKDFTLRALRNISEGEKITFNYLTTEWELFNKFDCNCGSKFCFGYIRGFRYLTREQQSKLRPLLSPYLRNIMK